MHAFERRSYKEIADALSILPQTVATRLVRARHRLREHLLRTLGQSEGPR
jgi:DNA-directed RNA polymerase specialized sigma24 family protein